MPNYPTFHVSGPYTADVELPPQTDRARLYGARVEFTHDQILVTFNERVPGIDSDWITINLIAEAE